MYGNVLRDTYLAALERYTACWPGRHCAQCSHRLRAQLVQKVRPLTDGMEELSSQLERERLVAVSKAETATVQRPRAVPPNRCEACLQCTTTTPTCDWASGIFAREMLRLCVGHEARRRATRAMSFG